MMLRTTHEPARGWPMETFMRLNGGLIVFVYHCFDRIVINGYLSMLSRPENVVYFFHKVVGIPLITKEVLVQRTHDYQRWVESAYGRCLATQRKGGAHSAGLHPLGAHAFSVLRQNPRSALGAGTPRLLPPPQKRQSLVSQNHAHLLLRDTLLLPERTTPKLAHPRNP